MADSGAEPVAESKPSKESVEKAPSATGEGKVPSSDCPDNPPCTTCTLLRCKTGYTSSTCAPCGASSIMKPSCCPPSPRYSSGCPCPPSPLYSSRCSNPPPFCSPRCPPSPSCATRCSLSPICGPRCPPSPICGPRCPPSPLSGSRCSPCSSSPRFTLPSRCFRCCEVTSCPIKLPSCDPISCPPYKCDPCRPKCDPCLSKCSPCGPRCDPCLPKCDPCKPKCNSDPNRYDPCCPCPEEEKKPEVKPPTPPPTPPTPPPGVERIATPPPQVIEKQKPCTMTPPPVHSCPSDVELERPKYFTESISGDDTWLFYGVRINYTDPASPGTSSVKVGQPLTVKLEVKVKGCACLGANNITAYMWTHMKTNCNPCGTWKDLPLHYQPDQSSEDECGNKKIVYGSTLTPRESDTFRLTFNVKFNTNLIWANNYGADNMVGVGN